MKDVNTRARVAPIFKTIIPKGEKYRTSVFSKGSVLWNSVYILLRYINLISQTNYGLSTLY